MSGGGLRAIVVGSDKDQLEWLTKAISEAGHFTVVLATESYPSAAALTLMLRVYAPHAFFLGVDKWDEVVQTRSALKEINRQIAAIGFGCTLDSEATLGLIRADFLDYVALGQGTPNIDALTDRVIERLRESPAQIETLGHLYSFLPAKPGVGTSTVALYSCTELSQQPGSRVLLADLDLNNGLIAFMAKLKAQSPPNELIEQAMAFDEGIWSQIVMRKGNLRIFAPKTGESDLRIEPSKIEAVIAFARTLHEFVCVDLSGNMEKYSTELLRRSDRIFLVCTPETPVLHLARTRFGVLRGLGVRDQVRLIVNRWHKGCLFSLADIGDMVGAPVYETIPNEYQSVHRALMNGDETPEKSALGDAFVALARRMREFDEPASESEGDDKVLQIRLPTSLGRLLAHVHRTPKKPHATQRTPTSTT
jgi:Flp pilus assembly CpaE family ATPase